VGGRLRIRVSRRLRSETGKSFAVQKPTILLNFLKPGNFVGSLYKPS